MLNFLRTEAVELKLIWAIAGCRRTGHISNHSITDELKIFDIINKIADQKRTDSIIQKQARK
jgi:hypothetical protein